MSYCLNPHCRFPQNPQIAARADGSLRVWDLSPLKIRQTLREHIKDINAIVMNPIRSLMATASRDTTIKIWIGD
ncbi:4-Cys prefix domain-containing protein [Roseofilum acuticapitatum]|uniref:4-Cys prefix domain-containing protein n=1 Tax=Roseofilum acuticapitatum TaxID=3082945 RepID=UPI003D2F8B9B